MPAGSRRPATVTAAAVLMVGVAVSGVAVMGVFLASTFGVVDRFREAAARTSAEQALVDTMASNMWWDAVIALVATVLFGALLTGLAAGNLRGRKGARIGTWVLCGAGLLCCSYLLLISGSAVFDRSTPVVSDLLYGLRRDAYPSWWAPLYLGFAGSQVTGQLIAVVLLALPPSHPYFHAVLPTDSLPYPDLKDALRDIY